MANTLGSQYGLNMPKLNKYEAVLIFDGNGRAGTPPLSNGLYHDRRRIHSATWRATRSSSDRHGPNGGLCRPRSPSECQPGRDETLVNVNDTRRAANYAYT